MTNLADLDLASAGALLASSEVSPLDLTRACLERARVLEPEVKAFVTLDEAGALAQARGLTDELAGSGLRGPLHGVPICIKDLIDVDGLPTTASSRVLEGNVAASDAPVVARLRAAGAVIVGKTNTQEFAYGVVTAPTRNPWDHGRIPGGSSGGTAAAVAAGMSLAGIGTDTAGSIRIPSALCGIGGLKPRPGIVPLDGIIPLAPSLDACGPMARTVEDLRLLLEVMSGHQMPAPDVRTLRLAVPANAGVTEADPPVAGAVDGAVRALASAGVPRVEVDLRPFTEWDRARSIPLMLEALEVHSSRGWYPRFADRYSEETLGSLRYAEKLTQEEIESGGVALSALVDDLNSVFSTADVLALPTTQVTAPRTDEATGRDAGHRTPVVRTLTRICGPVNVCGLAAVTIPCGFDGDGLPIGLHLVGRDEASVLALASLYQSLTDWHTRRPPEGH